MKSPRSAGTSRVVYLYGSLPVFQHAEGDLRSFRLITSQLIDMGAVRQVDIVNAFGVPLPTVKRYRRLCVACVVYLASPRASHPAPSNPLAAPDIMVFPMQIEKVYEPQRF